MKKRNTTGAATTSRRAFKNQWMPVLIFLVPALIIMVLLMVYPIIYTVTRSLFGASGDFVGLRNYQRIFSEPSTRIALRNNAIWVAIVPAVITALGLVLAVLTEKIRWATAFKVALFMPLVVSGLAAGVTFRFLYAGDPNIGLFNAVSQSVIHVFQPPGEYPGARPSMSNLVVEDEGALYLVDPVETGEQANFGLMAISPKLIPEDAAEVRLPSPLDHGVNGVVWLDFLRGGAGTRGVPDPGKTGLPGIRVEALQDGKVLGHAYTDVDGSFHIRDLEPGDYTIRLSESSFRKPFGGFYWLGPNLVIPSVIFAYIWISAGFSVIIIGAGLAGIGREYLEAGRVEGANEFQVFRHITMPLLIPILTVVFIRTLISVLKVFDLIMVIAPESVQADATVLALEMWRAAFGGARDFGLGSALATILFLLILPVVVSNVRRFRFEQ